MSRAIARTDGPLRVALAAPGALRWGVIVYSLYPLCVFGAIAAGRPRLALVATLLALAAACLTMPRWRRFGYVLLLAAPIPLIADVGIAQPLAFMPPVVLNLLLAGFFALTLRAGREPMISTFARLERGALEPDLARYTRRLTGVWVAFFVGAAVTSAWLAYAAPPAAWAWFVAVGNHVAVAMLFVGEWALRRRRFPQYRHASPLALAGIVVAHWRRPAALP
jgi:uncharacterized membrane protein